MPKVWVVIAAFNEAERLGPTLDGLASSGADIIVVDDGSTDHTSAVAAVRPVWIARHPINCGAGAALRTGIAFALGRGADIIVSFDADGQHDPADLPAMVAPIAEGRADVVIGSRFLGRTIDMPWSRGLVLAGARWFTRMSSGIAIGDPHNGLRAFSRAAAERIRITQDRMAHASEIVEQLRTLRLRWLEAPVTVRYTDATLAKGQSSWNAFRIVGQLLAGRVIK
jgi:glycosyltransferase involved in cell wall biosynthesis